MRQLNIFSLQNDDGNINNKIIFKPVKCSICKENVEINQTIYKNNHLTCIQNKYKTIKNFENSLLYKQNQKRIKAERFGNKRVRESVNTKEY